MDNNAIAAQLLQVNQLNKLETQQQTTLAQETSFIEATKSNAQHLLVSQEYDTKKIIQSLLPFHIVSTNTICHHTTLQTQAIIIYAIISTGNANDFLGVDVFIILIVFSNFFFF